MNTSPQPHIALVEALLDVRVKASGGAEADERVRAAADALRSAYPDERSGTGASRVGAYPYSSLRSQQSVRLRTEDGLGTVQVGPISLTVSWTGAFDGWETLVHDTREAWELYREALHPSFVSRLATRFVYRFQASSRDDLSRIFCEPPAFPSHGVILDAFSDRRSGSTLDGYTLHIRRRFEPRPIGPRASVYLDLEASHAFASGLPASADLPRPPLDRLRDLVADLARSTLTPDALDTIRHELP